MEKFRILQFVEVAGALVAGFFAGGWLGRRKQLPPAMPVENRKPDLGDPRDFVFPPCDTKRHNSEEDTADGVKK
jgi:hypothetical protein